MEVDQKLLFALSAGPSLAYITDNDPVLRARVLRQLATTLNAPFLQVGPEEQRLPRDFLRALGAALSADTPPREISEHYLWISEIVRNRGHQFLVLDG